MINIILRNNRIIEAETLEDLFWILDYIDAKQHEEVAGIAVPAYLLNEVMEFLKDKKTLNPVISLV